MSIEQEIINWDGKSSNDINVIYNRYCNDDSFITKIIKIFQQNALQKGATWLLKRYLENGRETEPNQIAAIFQLLPKLEHWESKLHILQCIQFMQIAETEKKEVEKFLRKCLTNSNKFVRAWAYHGFYEISIQHPEYKNETKQIFEIAMRDEASSIKARIRNIIKKGF